MIKRSIIIFFVTIIAATGYGQWTRISTDTQIPAFLGVNTGYGNVLTVRDGTIWMAFNSVLWQSTNQGGTWNVKTPAGVAPNDVVIDMDFWDRNTGILAVINNNPLIPGSGNVFITRDAGTTWSLLFNSLNNSNCINCFVGSCKFVRNANEIALSFDYYQDMFYITTDQGATWNARRPPFAVGTSFANQTDFPIYLATRRNGEILHLYDCLETPTDASGYNSYFARTTDNGATWTKSGTGLDFDNWQMAIDSCNENTIYVVNEDAVTAVDASSAMYSSTDKGATWRTSNAKPVNTAGNRAYYSGSVSAVGNGIAFAQTRPANQQVAPTSNDGVLRTTDKGATWTSIAGPSHWRDARMLSAINKDTVYAVDQFSTVWRWTQPIVPFVPDTLFKGARVQIICDSLMDTAFLPLKGCTPGVVSNISLTGITPGDYRIVRSNLDSIIVVFTPTATGLRTGNLSVTLLDGTNYLFPLRGTGVDSGYTVKSVPDSLFFRDSILTCKTLTQGLRLNFSGCVLPSLTTGVTKSVTGVAAADYSITMVGDSVTVTFSPKAIGRRRADGVIRFADGRSFTIPLGGWGLDPGPAAGFIPTPGFNLDVLLCQQVTRTFRFRTNKCITKDLTSQAIGGNAAGDYTLDQQLPNPLTGDDSITITFKPSVTGTRNATYSVTLSDGTIVTLPLVGRGTNAGGVLSTAPPVLFDKDTILTCRDITRDLSIQTNACSTKFVAYQFISGAAFTDYTLVVPAPGSLVGNEIAQIKFAPSLIGPRPATYTLVLTDSSRVVVPLQGTGKDPGQPLDITPTKLFDIDNVEFCKCVTRTLYIRSNVCITPTVQVQEITGLAGKDYTIDVAAPNPLTGFDSVIITFCPTDAGQRAALYTLSLPNGVTTTIPLLGTGVDPGYTFSASETTLFTGSNVERCSTLTRSFVITSSGCIVPSVKEEKINGASAGEYQLKSQIPSKLTGSDTVTITFIPGANGKRDAEYVLTLADGRQIKVTLEGTGIPGAYTIDAVTTNLTTVTQLFDRDSVSLCSSLDRKFIIRSSGCMIPTITGETITGADASDYMRTSQLPLSYSGTDTVTITFSPTAVGRRNAVYELTLSDGKKFTINLMGIGKNAGYKVTPNPVSMFASDSLLMCDSLNQTLYITRVGCATLMKNFSQIQGSAAADYTIVKDMPAAPTVLGANEQLILRFKPSVPGLRKADLVIQLDDGSLLTIPLLGVGVATQTLTLSTSAPVTTDTIGGDIFLPVFITGLTKPEPIDMDVFFDTSLVYVGTTSLAGTSVDVAGSRGKGTSKLRFAPSFVKLTGPSAYAHFRVYADSGMTTNVRFDNLIVTSANAPCEYVTAGATATTTVTGASGCGTTTISNFLRYGKTITLRIFPNPTPGTVMVASSQTLGETAITVTDAVGSIRHQTTTNITSTSPAAIDLSQLPSGTYFIRVAGSNAAVPVVVSK